MEVWTIQRVLDWSKDYLEKREVDAPRLTAELLLADVLGCSRVDLYLRFSQPLEEGELADYRGFLKRRVGREPTQYILGNQEFWSMTFAVDPRVLIPRPETECIIEEAVKYAKLGCFSSQGRFLDIGTGSGAIVCALASEFPEASLDAVDISADALAVAEANVQEHGFDDRIQLHQGDLFAPFGEERFSLIVSNPPYITEEEMEALQEEVRFEPVGALVAGDDGLDVVRRLLAQAPDFLLPAGMLLIELGSSQGADALKLAEQGPFAYATIRQDYAGLDRVLVCSMQEPREEHAAPVGAIEKSEEEPEEEVFLSEEEMFEQHARMLDAQMAQMQEEEAQQEEEG